MRYDWKKPTTKDLNKKSPTLKKKGCGCGNKKKRIS